MGSDDRTKEQTAMSLQRFARGSVVRAHDRSAGRLTPGDAGLIVS